MRLLRPLSVPVARIRVGLSSYIIIRMNYIYVTRWTNCFARVDALYEISSIFIRIISQGLTQWIKSMLHNVTRKLHFTNGHNVYDYSGSISRIIFISRLYERDRERERENWFFWCCCDETRISHRSIRFCAIIKIFFFRDFFYIFYSNSLSYELSKNCN